MTDPTPQAGRTLAAVGAAFDHAAHAAHRIRDLLPIYADLLGGRFLGGGDNPRTGFRAVQLEFERGGKVELIEPLAGSTFLDRFLARGGGLHHVTFTVVDITAAIAALERLGYTPTAPFLDEPQWREVFLHPRQAQGALIQLAQPGGQQSWGWVGLTLDDVLAGRGPEGTGTPSP